MLMQASVWPSGLALISMAGASVPAAPALTSTMTCWPSTLVTVSPSMRMCTSVTPPAAKGL